MHPNPDTVPATPVESASPASGAAATDEIAERLAGALAELQAVHVMLQERLENLARREAELAGVQAQIDQQTRTQLQRHLEMEERQNRLDEQSGQLAARRQELELLAGDLAQRQQAVVTAQEELGRNRLELQARGQQLDSLRAALEAREGELEQRAAEIERRAAELEARQAELTKREADLAAGRAELAQWREALDAECSRMAAEQEALERLRIELESREEELLAEQALLERRHQALVRFQQAFSEVAATLDLARAGTFPDDPPSAARTPPGVEEPMALELEPVDEKARSTAAGGPPDILPAAAHEHEEVSEVDAGSAPREEAESACGAGRGPAGPPAASPPPESDPPRVRENCGAGEPSPSHDVDESKLDPQELLRLRVLRRLTGGKLTDAQLLERIRQERAAATESAPGRKGWRRWWS